MRKLGLAATVLWLASLSSPAIMAGPSGAGTASADTCDQGDGRGAPTAEQRDRDAWASDLQQSAGTTPAIDQLSTAMQAVSEVQQAQSHSFWARLRDWLMGTISNEARSAAPPEWLRWLMALPQAFWKGLALAITGLLVAMLIYIIATELRAAGLFRREREKRQQAAIIRRRTVGGMPATALLADITALPLRDRLPALLGWAIARLRALQRLPADDSLTARELARCLQDEPERSWFGALTRLHERQVYAGHTVDEVAVAPLLDGARRLESAGTGQPR